ncbi:hypothetical protein [Polluticaenibacter yanchengensis]|uniref:Glycoside hydrolase family 19 catalytic domain-containing protein n=1 Tax=Polluticaenibacter yanchengensis TaxID=3014562 RepID=A0ABT4UIR4_9BACT|nr:hypothetical protein [Chitinophagaceae bacterium LY-5]
MQNKLDRKQYFDNLRPIFGGKLTKQQVETLEAIAVEYEFRNWTDRRWLAAVIATSIIEVGINLQPVSENLNYSAQGLADTFPSKCAVNAKAKPKVPNSKAILYQRRAEKIANYVYAGLNGNRSEQYGDGWRYRGMGICQTTGRANYRKIQEAYNASHDNKIDLLNNPELLLRLDLSIFAMFEGMENGIYTGVKLSDYFTNKKTDWYNSRKIINGTFKAKEYEALCIRIYEQLIKIS